MYGSETWPVKVNDMRRLERAENVMVRWMCDVSLKDRRKLVELRERLGIECVGEVVSRGRLRWYGHVERRDKVDWVSACRELEVEGMRGKGRGKKTWVECVKDDMRRLGLKKEDAQDRKRWRGLSLGNRLTLPQRGKEEVVR